MKNMRKNALTLPTIRLMTENYLSAVNVAALHRTALVAHNMETKEYHYWIDSWKATYAMLSHQIAFSKRRLYRTPEIQQKLQDLKILANTMLNSRQTAKNVRREYFDNIEKQAKETNMAWMAERQGNGLNAYHREAVLETA